MSPPVAPVPPAGAPTPPRAPRGARDPEGWRIGRVAGVPVVLARSWVVIAVVVTVLFQPSVAATAPALGTAGTLLVALTYAVVLAASVLVHETAHALTARAVGLPPTRIVLTLWGGHTSFENEAATPAHSFWVSVVGPVSNAVLAGVGAFLLAVGVGDGKPLVDLLVGALTLANLFVAVFNVLPGLPLDGGRLLEAAVWALTGDRLRGTVVAAWAGRVLAVLVVVGLLGPSLARGSAPSLLFVAWAALVGGTLWTGASAVLRDARLRGRVLTLRAGALARPAVGVPQGVTVADVARAATAAGAEEVVLLAPGGQPVAVVDREAVGAVPGERWGVVPAAAVARGLTGPPVPEGAGGEHLLRLLAAAGERPDTVTGAEVVAVVDPGGRVVGLLRGTDVVRAARAGASRATAPRPADRRRNVPPTRGAA